MLLTFTLVWPLVWVFLDTSLFLIRNSELQPLDQTSICYVMAKMGLSDSAAAGGASMPHCLHHRTSDLLIEGSSISGVFRQPPEGSFASSTGTEY